MHESFQITIDDKSYSVTKGESILDVCRRESIDIPTLCHHPSLEPNGACRLCVVEITRPEWDGWSKVVTSCLYSVEPDLEVSTASDMVVQSRKTLLELYLARVPDSEEIKSLAAGYGITETSFPKEEDADKCIMCGLCTRVCRDLGPAAIATIGRGTDKMVGPRPDRVGEDCTGCGACHFVCPTGEIEMTREPGKAHIWNRSFTQPVCQVDPTRCRGETCQMCVKVCPLEIPTMVDDGASGKVSQIDGKRCIGCGLCAGVCPAGTIEQYAYPANKLSLHDKNPEELEGKVVVFACSRSPLPDDLDAIVVPVPCIGRVSVENMMECLARGVDGVLLMCRDQATCPTGRGGALGQNRSGLADEQLAASGMGEGRIRYVRPEPGLEGPAKAVAAFREELDASPLTATGTFDAKSTEEIGMDRAHSIKQWFGKNKTLKEIRALPKRTITQTISFVMLHSSFWDWAQVKWLCNPVLSCHSCPLAWFACPIGVFVHYSGYHVIPYLALGTVVVIGVLFARLLCGWVCPFGFLQDLLYKIPTWKFLMPAWTRFIKYGVLIFGVFLIPFFLGEQTAFSFCRICPAAALQSTIPNLINTGASVFQTLIMVKLGFLVFFMVLTTFSYRAFCKVVCPIGAFLAPLNTVSLWKMKPPTHDCISCGWCDKACPPAGNPSSRVATGESTSRNMDCVLCYECKKVCPMAGRDLLPGARE